jgi:hypothetical protein
MGCDSDSRAVSLGFPDLSLGISVVLSNCEGKKGPAVGTGPRGVAAVKGLTKRSKCHQA